MPVYTLSFCENSPSSLRCPIGFKLSIVNAWYGRNDRSTCLSMNGGCSLCAYCYLDITQSISQEANNLNSYSFTPSNSYGDPCPGTFKYAVVKYQCVK